jgi:hypothetical protein
VRIASGACGGWWCRRGRWRGSRRGVFHALERW